MAVLPMSHGEPTLESLAVSVEGVKDELKGLREDVAEVKAFAKETNGRVRKVELWQARIQGAQSAVKWLPQFIIAAAASGAGALIALVVH